MECILRNLDVTKKLLQPFSLSPIAETFHAHLSRSTQRQQQHVVHQPTVCSHCTSEIAFLLAPPTRTTHKDGCLNCCGTAAVTPLNYNISLQVCDAVKKISCKPKSSRTTTGRKIDSSYAQVEKKKCPGFIFIISLQSVSLFGREDWKIFTNWFSRFHSHIFTFPSNDDGKKKKKKEVLEQKQRQFQQFNFQIIWNSIPKRCKI